MVPASVQRVPELPGPMLAMVALTLPEAKLCAGHAVCHDHDAWALPASRSEVQRWDWHALQSEQGPQCPPLLRNICHDLEVCRAQSGWGLQGT